MKKKKTLANRAILGLTVLILIIFPLGQLAKLPLGLQNINIYLFDPVIIVLDMVLAWTFIRNFLGYQDKNRQKTLFTNWRRRPFFHQLLIYFSAIAFFSWLINLGHWGLEKSLPGLLYGLRWTAYLGVFFAAQKLTQTYRAHWQETLNRLAAISASTIAILGLIQYLWIPNLIFMKYFGWDDHYYRLTAPYFDPGFTGIILVVSILFLMSKIKNKNLPYYFLLGIQFVALLLTYSRSSYLALLAGLFILFWAKKRLIYFSAVTAFIVAIIFLLPRPGGEGVKLSRTSTISAREKNYQQSLLVIRKNPLPGDRF